MPGTVLGRAGDATSSSTPRSSRTDGPMVNGCRPAADVRVSPRRVRKADADRRDDRMGKAVRPGPRVKRAEARRWRRISRRPLISAAQVAIDAGAIGEVVPSVTSQQGCATHGMRALLALLGVLAGCYDVPYHECGLHVDRRSRHPALAVSRGIQWLVTRVASGTIATSVYGDSDQPDLTVGPAVQPARRAPTRRKSRSTAIWRDFRRAFRMSLRCVFRHGWIEPPRRIRHRDNRQFLRGSSEPEHDLHVTLTRDLNYSGYRARARRVVRTVPDISDRAHGLAAGQTARNKSASTRRSSLVRRDRVRHRAESPRGDGMSVAVTLAVKAPAACRSWSRGVCGTYDVRSSSRTRVTDLVATPRSRRRRTFTTIAPPDVALPRSSDERRRLGRAGSPVGRGCAVLVLARAREVETTRRRARAAGRACRMPWSISRSPRDRPRCSAGCHTNGLVMIFSTVVG